MVGFDLRRRLVAEALGTGLLVATVVGSGIMAAKLAGNAGALALLCNTIPTGAILAVLITVFAPVSGAHFNPAVSAALALRGSLPTSELLPYVLAQIAGGIAGSALAHGMFDLPLMQFSATARSGIGQWLGEVTAAFGLLLTIFGCVAVQPSRCAVVRRTLHHRGILVHQLDQLREPGGDDRARLLGHVRRHPPCRRPGLHRRPAPRRPDRSSAERLAVHRGAGETSSGKQASVDGIG